MTAVRWDEAPIGKPHDRAAFDCGDSDRDLYLPEVLPREPASGQMRCRGRDQDVVSRASYHLKSERRTVR